MPFLFHEGEYAKILIQQNKEEDKLSSKFHFSKGEDAKIRNERFGKAKAGWLIFDEEEYAKCLIEETEQMSKWAEAILSGTSFGAF